MVLIRCFFYNRDHTTAGALLRLRLPRKQLRSKPLNSKRMRKSKFTEAQIVAILAQYEQGIKGHGHLPEHGISQPTFYQWQRKYSMEISELKRLKEMEQEAGPV